jgi:Transposase and inactivated derivatives, IS5 family
MAAPPGGSGQMLRIHFPQQWYALSDPAAEKALYDSASMRATATHPCFGVWHDVPD